jgi:hypothetical protein
MLYFRRAILFAGILIIGVGIFIGLRNLGAYKRDTGKEGAVSSNLVPSDQAKVVVSGWSEPELSKIISDFARKYGWSRSSLPLRRVSGSTYEVDFPNGVAADDLIFLVNYLQYPEGFDLKTRLITPIGLTRLGPSFGLSDKSLTGKQAVIYIPSNDTDYDQVYVHVRPAVNFRVPFTTMNWIRTNDLRLPAAVARLANSSARQSN